jgi:putative transposase
MNTLYSSLGISKQSFHQRMDRSSQAISERKQLLLLIYQIREDHPTMGCRDMYYKLKPEIMGRDAFERFCKEEGLMSERPRNWRRTTDSTGVIRFDNLIVNLTIDRLNQVWQSDITYFEVDGKFYYITFIEDAFSRRIIGHYVSNRLYTEQTTLPALETAIRNRKNAKLDGLTFHSDGGGQYYDKEFLKLTKKHKIINSMCEYPWENGKVERINGVIKNNYLKHRVINSFNDLIKEVDRSVKLYNEEKPHCELRRKTPVEFEKHYICTHAQKSSDEGEDSLKASFLSEENLLKNSSTNLLKTVNAI